jgi:hypothetical protein
MRRRMRVQSESSKSDSGRANASRSADWGFNWILTFRSFLGRGIAPDLRDLEGIGG